MAVRRIAKEQPDSFVFDDLNLSWAQEQINKFPRGKQASAVIPLLWRAQEQHNGWLPEPAMRYVGEMLDMPFIRVLEVATFYTMFQLQPVGSVAHVQVCGTTPCMLRGSEALIDICKARLSQKPHHLSDDGKFSWEEVECLGACVNAPMVQIFKDTFEDLTPETFESLLEDIDAGRPVVPGPQNGRHFSANSAGRTQLMDDKVNFGPVADPHIPPYVIKGHSALIGHEAKHSAGPNTDNEVNDRISPIVAHNFGSGETCENTNRVQLNLHGQHASAAQAAFPPDTTDGEKVKAINNRPKGLSAPRDGVGDDLKKIRGISSVIEAKLNVQGIWHFDQIASWDRSEICWFDQFLSFKGRIDRDGWLDQARLLSAGGNRDISGGEADGSVSSELDEVDEVDEKPSSEGK